jgi:predicted signal transduction protein with EAL and GGDEF domain
MLRHQQLTMNDQVETRRAALQQFAQRQQEDSLRLLHQYVESRRKTFEVFSRIEPDSKHALEAKALLEKAQADYDALAASIGALAASIGVTSEPNEDNK